MDMIVVKTTVMRISRQPSPVQIMIDLKQFENVVYFNYLDSIITNKARCKVKVIPRQAEVTQGVPGRLKPRIFLTFRHYKGCRSSAKRTGRLYPRRNPWYSLSHTR